MAFSGTSRSGIVHSLRLGRREWLGGRCGCGHGARGPARQAPRRGGARLLLESARQLAGQLPGRRRALGRVAGHPAAQHLGDRLRGRRPVVAQVRRRSGCDRVGDLDRRLAVARPAPGERLVTDRRERVDVDRRPGLAALELLGRHVGGGAQHRAAAGDARAVGRRRDAEVDELRDRVVAQQHVGRLDVAVDHPVGVRVVERSAELARHARHPPRAQRAVAQRGRERLTGHVLHDDQHALVVDRGVVDRHEVRVVQRRAELRLAHEALLDVSRAVGMQPLDRHLAVETFVLAQQHGRHSPGAQMPEHAVAPVQQRSVRRCRHSAGGTRTSPATNGRCWSFLETLDERARAEPAAAAHRDEPDLLVGALELVDAGW